MKTKYFLNNKEITKEAAVEFLGIERFNARLEDAKQAFRKDPEELISWMDGFSIEFI